MSDITTLIRDKIVPLLDSPQQHGSYWMAKCPLHADGVRSLGVRPHKDGSHPVVTCFAGCDRTAILACYGLEWRDIYVRDGPLRYDTDPIATYIYHDADGTGLYRKTRHPARNGGKFFRYWVPDKAGNWITRPGIMDGVTRVPFRLPQMLNAPQNGVAPVFWVEGEKDAEVFALHGEIATTAGGANDWRDNMASYFNGREVLIVADKDKAGYRHAYEVWSDMKKVAAFAWIVQAKEGKDATDHYLAGHGVSDFEWLEI